MNNLKTIRKEASNVAKASEGLLGARPLQRVVCEHLGFFLGLRAGGATWEQVATFDGKPRPAVAHGRRCERWRASGALLASGSGSVTMVSSISHWATDFHRPFSRRAYCSVSSSGKHQTSSPRPSTRAGNWRCARSKAPRHRPSHQPPIKATSTPETNSTLDKTWGQGHLLQWVG
jgi:hypothetical protein